MDRARSARYALESMASALIPPARTRRWTRVEYERLVDSQLPIALDDRPEPEPDISVVPRDPGAYISAHPSRAALIVEIAESSDRIGREHKASLYARAGVAHY